MLFKIKSAEVSCVAEKAHSHLSGIHQGREEPRRESPQGEAPRVYGKSEKMSLLPRKDTKLALKRHVATADVTYGYLCSV